MSEVLWPYEETRFEFPDARTVRLKTPWKSIEVPLEADARIELEQLVLRRDEIPASNQRAYFSRFFADERFEPFFYIVPREDRRNASSSAALGGTALRTKRIEKLEAQVPEAFRMPVIRKTWDVEAALKFARLHGSEVYDAVSLMTSFRRTHLIEQEKLDAGDRLREMIADIKDAGLLEKAEGFLRFHQADITERRRLMAVQAFPLRKNTKGSMPLTNLLSETFNELIDGPVLSFVTVSLFVQEKPDPTTLALASALPPITRAYAMTSAELVETSSKILNHLTLNLCYEIQQLIDAHALAARERTPTAS